MTSAGTRRPIDWNAGRIRIRRNYTCGEFGTPKPRRSTRSVPMTPQLADALRVLQLRTRYRRPDDLVFAHPEHGGVIPKANIACRFKIALESFVDSFKAELIADRVWRTRSQLELAIVERVAWFNTERLHGALDDIPPAEFEHRYARQTQTRNTL